MTLLTADWAEIVQKNRFSSVICPATFRMDGPFLIISESFKMRVDIDAEKDDVENGATTEGSRRSRRRMGEQVTVLLAGAGTYKYKLWL